MHNFTVAWLVRRGGSIALSLPDRFTLTCVGIKKASALHELVRRSETRKLLNPSICKPWVW